LSRIELPSLLLTTSRKTSNRVRTFVRDLSSVLPEIDRFNRGGMGISELVARIAQNGARAALIISIWKGNPGEMSFISSNGDEILRLKLESVLLRREVNPKGRQRICTIDSIILRLESSEKVRALAEDIATLLNLEVFEQSSPTEVSTEDNRSFIWFEDVGTGKILWTHYATPACIEIGPRIRVSDVRRQILNEHYQSQEQDNFRDTS
jgi:rRNA maturation protein Rpf1